MLVSFTCGYLLSRKTCDLRLTRVERYLGMLGDSGTATFRVQQDKPDTLHQVLGRAAFDEGLIPFRTLQRLRGKCTSTVAIRRASLCSPAMFSAFAVWEKSGLSRVGLTLNARADLIGELVQGMRFVHLRMGGTGFRSRVPLKPGGEFP